MYKNDQRNVSCKDESGLLLMNDTILNRIKEFFTSNKWPFISLLLMPCFFVNNVFLNPFLYDFLFSYLLWPFTIFAFYNFFFIKKKKSSVLLIVFFVFQLWMTVEQLRCSWLNWTHYCNILRSCLIALIIETYLKDDPVSLIKGSIFNFECAIYPCLISICINLAKGTPKADNFIGYYNNVIVFLLPAICIASIYIRLVKKTVRAYLLISVSILVAFLSTAATPRGSMIGFTGAVIIESVLFYVVKIKKLSVWPWYILALSFGVFLVFFYREGLFPLLEEFVVKVLHRSTNFTGRIDVWDKFIEVIMERPIFGYGDSPYFYINGLYIPHAHNYYLNTVVEFGLIGLVIYLIFSFIMLNGTEKKKDDFLKIIFIGLIFAVELSYITDFITRSYLYYFIFFIGFHYKTNEI